MLRRFGVIRMSAALTVISIAASLLITTVITTATGGGGPGFYGLLIATVVPLIVAPIMSVQMLALLHRLDLAEARLRELAITDELTQAYNRRYFISLAEAELARIRRYGGTCTLAILDLDNFKTVNDTIGHLAGDEALREFSRECRKILRAGDTFARYGGDEFVVLLPNTSPKTAHEVLDRLRATLAANHNGQLRLSAGIAGLDPAAPDLDQLVKRADDALYAAKRAGGDRVVDEGA
jgi:diguanylate cyclase (GGDEF)-like protein